MVFIGRPCVCPSVHPSVIHSSVRFLFLDDINGFSPNLVCALILWRSGLGLLMGKFTELSARDTIMAGYYSLMFLFFFLMTRHHNRIFD